MLSTNCSRSRCALCTAAVGHRRRDQRRLAFRARPSIRSSCSIRCVALSSSHLASGALRPAARPCSISSRISTRSSPGQQRARAAVRGVRRAAASSRRAQTTHQSAPLDCGGAPRAARSARRKRARACERAMKSPRPSAALCAGPIPRRQRAGWHAQHGASARQGATARTHRSARGRAPRSPTSTELRVGGSLLLGPLASAPSRRAAPTVPP